MTETVLEKKRKEKIAEDERRAKEQEAELEVQIPKPVGYRVLIALPNVEETFESGLIKTVEWYIKNEEWITNIPSGEYTLERIGKEK